MSEENITGLQDDLKFRNKKITQLESDKESLANHLENSKSELTQQKTESENSINKLNSRVAGLDARVEERGIQHYKREPPDFQAGEVSGSS